MKKQLFLGSALLAAIGAFAQPSKEIREGFRKVVSNKYVINENLQSVQDKAPVHTANNNPVTAKRSSATAVDAQWTLISQSMNFFGVLVPSSKCVYYNHELDAVSFIQRTSKHYTPSPAPSADARSGVMVAMVSPDWGAHWDSTCIFNNDLYLTRYPQGGIFNPPMNTQLSNAYVVAMGPGTTPPPQSWIGNFFASKKLDSYNNIADVTDPLSQQFIKSIPVDSVVGKVDFCRLDFCIPDDDIVRSLGPINDNTNGASGADGFRGGRIVKGAFTSGHFVWTSDSISLHLAPTYYDTVTKTWPNQLDIVNMAWSQSGQVGYVWFMGINEAATNNNIGIQPIVLRTTNGGAAWAAIPGINFNDTTHKYDFILNAIESPTAAGWPKAKIPYFNYLEDFEGVVDAKNELHLVSTLWSTKDTTTFGITQFTNTAGDGQVYRYKHTPGHEVYIYDFSTKTNSSGNVTTWDAIVVDSMMTEAPTAISTGIGYSENPWKVYDGSKQNSNARIQLSRPVNGKYIVYTWAESNTQITDAGRRWNNKPDIHVRMRNIDSMNIMTEEYDITGPADEANVQAAAFMHNVSPICKITPGLTNLELKLPVKISNSPSLEADKDANHYYSTAILTFSIVSTVGIEENGMINADASVLYPNPAKNNVSLQVDLKKNSDVVITVMNTVGQVVSTSTAEAVAGKNDINVNINGLSSGIYMVNLNINGAKVTKKLIIE